MTRDDLGRVDYCIDVCAVLVHLVERGARPADILAQVGRIKGTLNVMKASKHVLRRPPRRKAA